MNLSDYIKENEDTYKMAVEISKALPKARKSIVDEFFSRVISSLQSTLDSQWTIEVVGDLLMISLTMSCLMKKRKKILSRGY